MNEKILNELLSKSHIVIEVKEGMTREIAAIDYNKFADLIVKECASVAKSFTHCDVAIDKLPAWNVGYLACAQEITDEIKDHFGVE